MKVNAKRWCSVPGRLADSLDASSRAFGFTLVELAVVLTVVAILFAIVLKSTSVTDSAKANDLVVIAGDLSDAARQFRDKYKYLPGDDPNAATDLPNVAPAAVGNGNGLIDFNASNVMEPNLAANHLFQAGLIRVSPDPTVGAVMKSYFGNVWLMSYGLAGTPGGGGRGSPCGPAVDTTSPLPTARNVIVFANIPSAIAMQIDQKYDDGRYNSGSIRASSAYSTAPNASAIACFAMPL